MKRLLTLCVGTTLIIATPSSAEMFFDGVPWTTWPEIVVVTTLFYLFGFRANRQAIAEALNKLTKRRWMFVLTMLGVLIPVKVLMYAAFSTSGQFEACYGSPADTLNGDCRRTFEPLPILAKHGQQFDLRSTSVDVISFGPREQSASGISQTNWRLPMFNSWEFEVCNLCGLGSTADIEVSPFRAEFRGLIDLSTEEQLRVRYVGEGTLTIDGVATQLPASYGAARMVNIFPSNSSAHVELLFDFHPDQANIDTGTFSFASLVLESGRDGEFAPVHAALSMQLKLLNWILDSLVAAICLWILRLLRGRLRSPMRAIFIGVVAGLSVMGGSIPIVERLLPVEIHIVVLMGLTVLAMKRRWEPSQMFLGYLITSVALVRDEIFAAFGQFPALDQVLIRMRGNDHLVYHAQVREMLVSGWLRGGENIFYYQPGIRYYFYLQNVLFGESGVVTGVMSVVLMGLGIWFIASRLHSEDLQIRRLQYLGIISLLIWWSSSHTTQSSIFGLSEFGTWIIVLYMIGLMLQSSTNLQIVVVAVLGGMAVWIRPNQGLAMIGLVLGAAICSDVRGYVRMRRASVGLGIMMMILLLIPLHNYVFGGVIVFQPVGAVVASQLTWDQLSRILTDSVAQDFLLNNLKAALYLPSFLPEIYSYRLALAILGFWITIVLIAVRLVRTRTPMLLLGFAFVVITAQAVPFLKYTIVRYHPIQIVAIHLTAILMMLYLSVRDRDDESGTVTERDVLLAE